MFKERIILHLDLIIMKLEKGSTMSCIEDSSILNNLRNFPVYRIGRVISQFHSNSELHYNENVATSPVAEYIPGYTIIATYLDGGRCVVPVSVPGRWLFTKHNSYVLTESGINNSMYCTCNAIHELYWAD